MYNDLGYDIRYDSPDCSNHWEQDRPLQVKFKKLDPSAKIPARNHKNDAGIDIYTNEVSVWLDPGKIETLSTGIQSEIPEGYCMLIWDRSSMGSCGIGRLAGVIDSGYRGEWKIVLANHGEETMHIIKGHKIAQGILTKLIDYYIVEVEELADSERGEKGFGSSGR